VGVSLLSVSRVRPWLCLVSGEGPWLSYYSVLNLQMHESVVPERETLPMLSGSDRVYVYSRQTSFGNGKTWLSSLIAPTISCSLSDAPATISSSKRHNQYDENCLDMTFTYAEPNSGPDAERRPITFYRPALFAASTWDILHHTSNGLITMGKNRHVPLPDIDEPRLLSLATNNVDFVSLSPGQSWSDRIPVDDDELAESFQAGERYTFRFNGAVVQWWDWGTLQVRAYSDNFRCLTGGVPVLNSTGS
jgi:hypothetical protein